MKLPDELVERLDDLGEIAWMAANYRRPSPGCNEAVKAAFALGLRYASGKILDQDADQMSKLEFLPVASGLLADSYEIENSIKTIDIVHP